MTQQSDKKLPQGRRAITNEKLRQTVIEQLHTLGYSAITIEGVCAASGVAKTTLYRRWKSKAEMIFELVIHTDPNYEYPDTGTIQGDIATIAADAVNFICNPLARKALPGLLEAIAADPALHDRLHTVFIQPAHQAITHVLRRAEARGEIAAQTHLDPDIFYAALIGIPLCATQLLRLEDTNVLTEKLAAHLLASLDLRITP
ncbi:MAG: TetR/AcrR family transcriptional regulator [Corynebacterium sp.]|nr:TetR/AcrR family transcriptional regulator [Corynebacterium sp.]